MFVNILIGTEIVERRGIASKYRIFKHWWQSVGYSCRFSEDQLDESSMHGDRREDRVIQTSGEALASNWLGTDLWRPNNRPHSGSKIMKDLASLKSIISTICSQRRSWPRVRNICNKDLKLILPNLFQLSVLQFKLDPGFLRE